jgi:hypothetical protein
MDEEKDPISDLRILMNNDVIDSKKFFELQNIFKLMPELIKQAKKNK